MRHHIALLSCLLLASACGGGSKGDSGLDRDTKLADLDDGELRAYCEWVIATSDQINDRIEAECPDQEPLAMRSVDACVLNLGAIPAECPATVDHGEVCLTGYLEDPCTGFLLLCAGFTEDCRVGVP